MFSEKLSDDYYTKKYALKVARFDSVSVILETSNWKNIVLTWCLWGIFCET